MGEEVEWGEELCVRTGLQRLVSGSGDSLMVKTKRMLVLRPEILTENLNQAVSEQDDGILINGHTTKLPSSTYPFTHRSVRCSPLLEKLLTAEDGG